MRYQSMYLPVACAVACAKLVHGNPESPDTIAFPLADFRTCWSNGGFTPHGTRFLRVRSPAQSTVEGVNRAMVKFEVVSFSRDIGRALLILPGRNSTESEIELLGFVGDGRVTTADADAPAESLALFTQPHREAITIDVTRFVRDAVRTRQAFIGFRLQLASENDPSPRLAPLTEWFVNPTLSIERSCPADCDQSTESGVLDIFDFLCFQSLFVTNQPEACDCDTATGAGVCDTFDFLCFQRLFLAGCP